MNNIIFLALFLISVLIPNSDIEDADNQKLKIKNPEAQHEVNKIRREFKEDRDLLHEEYELMIRDLKEERKEKMKELRKKYRKRLQRLKKKYPDIPDINLDSKPKPKLKPPKGGDGADKKDKSFRKKKNKRKKIKDVTDPDSSTIAPNNNSSGKGDKSPSDDKSDNLKD